MIKGANPSIKDDKGKTAFDYVADISSDRLKEEAQ